METYYDPKDLAKFGEIGEEAPELSQKFFDYYAAVFAEGALTEREKNLIALAVAHAVQLTTALQQSRQHLAGGLESLQTPFWSARVLRQSRQNPCPRRL